MQVVAVIVIVIVPDPAAAAAVVPIVAQQHPAPIPPIAMPMQLTLYSVPGRWVEQEQTVLLVSAGHARQ